MRTPRIRMMLDGHRYGRLLVLGEAPRRSERRYWHCRCDCGGETIVEHSKLRAGEIRSCGCLLREVTAAQSAARWAARAPGYMTWRTMHLRCTNPGRHDYAAFGGRGIRVCAAWEEFATFARDMGPRPSPRHRFIRLDQTRDFAPENCIWATDTDRRCLKRTHPECGSSTDEATIAAIAAAGPTVSPAPHEPSADRDPAFDDGRLTIPQGAAATGLSRATIGNWIRSGRLPSTRRNGQHAVRLADLFAGQRRAHLGTVLPDWRAEPERVGKRLRTFREAAGLSQEALAASSGVSNNTISKLEHGAFAPSVATVRALAEALRIESHRFVDDEPIGLSTMTAAEAAAFLDVSLERVQIWLQQGHLPGSKVSGEWRVPAVAVSELERSGRMRGRSRRLDHRYRG